MARRIVAVVCAAVMGCMAGCASLPGASKAAELREMNHLKMVAMACFSYAAGNGEMLPENTEQLRSYLEDMGGTFDLTQVELVTKGKSLAAVPDATGTVLARWKAVSSSGRRAVVFVDGHCAMVAEK